MARRPLEVAGVVPLPVVAGVVRRPLGVEEAVRLPSVVAGVVRLQVVEVVHPLGVEEVGHLPLPEEVVVSQPWLPVAREVEVRPSGEVLEGHPSVEVPGDRP